MLLGGIVAGAGLGIGALLVVAGLIARPRPLAEALAELDRQGPPPSRSSESARLQQIAVRVDRAIDDLGLVREDVVSDLAVLDRTSAEHAVHRLSAALAGLLLPPALTAIAWLGGVQFPIPMVVLAALLLAVGGLALPDRLARAQATERRRDFRFALSSYLDLVVVLLAAGVGAETALADAACTGNGWAFQRIRLAVDRSRLTGETPWQGFHRLGRELDLPELRELASSLDLAGTHGARIRASLRSRSRSLRARDLSDMEGYAEAATERMSVPSVVLVVGFILFVGFPATYQILGF